MIHVMTLNSDPPLTGLSLTQESVTEVTNSWFKLALYVDKKTQSFQGTALST